MSEVQYLDAITTQADALRYWPRHGGVPLLSGWRGRQHCAISVGGIWHVPVRARVWERLLERNDLEIRTDGYDKWLWITAQGKERADNE